MATCPRCWEYLAQDHRCRGRWRPLLTLAFLVIVGASLGAAVQLAADERHLPLIGTVAGGVIAFVLYQVLQTFFAERDIQLRTVRWASRRAGFHPFRLLALRRQAEQHRRSWRAGLSHTRRKHQARLLELLLEQDALEAQLDLLCETALEEAARLTGARYHTMSEPVLMPGPVATIEWTVVGPAGIIAFSEDWPAELDAEAMAHRLSAAIQRRAAG